MILFMKVDDFEKSAYICDTGSATIRKIPKKVSA